jgi:hypothetical protein
LFVPDDASLGESDTGIDDTLLMTEIEDVSSGAAPGTADPRHSSREAAAVTAERKQLQQQEFEYRAAVADQERLRKEAEDRAAAEAAEQVRLQREEEERVAFAAEQERLRQEAERVAAEAAEQERLQREAITAKQARLQREEEERAMVVAAEQERLRQEQEARVLAEQERFQKEAQERAFAEAAEQERLQQIQREAEEQAAEQERVRGEAEKQAAEQSRLEREAEERAAEAENERRAIAASVEEERIAQERAIALAHLEQGDEHASVPTDTVLVERSSATTQTYITPDLPSLITQLREASDSPDEDHSTIATQNVLEDGGQTASDSHAVDVPTNDIVPPQTIAAGLESITEEAEVSNPVPTMTIARDSSENVSPNAGGLIKRRLPTRNERRLRSMTTSLRLAVRRMKIFTNRTRRW